MIDILLALQINNWNQKRINKQKEEVLLVGLKSDLQDNIYQLEKYHGINDKKIHVLQKIASSTYDTMTNSMSNIYELYNTRMQHAPPVRNNILQEMLSTGSIALLQNVKLKEEILNYYTFVEDRSLALGILFGEWPSIISSYFPAESVYEDLDSKKKFEKFTI